MADRTVSVELRAKLSGFEKLKVAEQNAASLSRQMTETGASAQAMRKRLEAATKALPKIAIDADSTAAEIKFAEVRAELEKLSGKRIGIDVDAGVARAQIEELTRELEALARNEPDINVRADIGEAIGQLQLVNREVDRVDGRRAEIHVNANAGGALASIATVGAALAALPAVTTVAVSVAALGGAFTAAGLGAVAFSAAAVPALGRINAALTAQESAAKGAGAATGGAGQSAAQAAQQAMQLEQAEQRLKQAQVDRKSAQEDLTRAVEDGRRALQDQNFELEQSVLSQKDAELAVREAEARLVELQSSGKASGLEIERAMLSVDQAHERAREQEIKTQRTKLDTAAANKAGVKGTQEYQRGLDDLRQAEQKVQQASDQLKMAHLQQQAAMSSGGGGAAKLKDAFADLNSQEKELAKGIKGFKDEYVAWQRSLEPDTFPVIAQGMDLLRLGMKDATPLAKSAASAFLTLGKDAEASLRGPFWGEFLFDVNTQMPNAIVGLGHSFGNVVTGIAGVVDAFLPFTGTVVGGLESATKAWSDWGQQLQNSPEFHEFILFAKQNAPAVWQVVKDLAGALKNVGESVAPLGVGAFSGLGLLARIVKDMDPEQIRAIALGILAVKTAQAGLGVAKFWGDLIGKLEGLGGAADTTKGKLSGLGSSLAAGGGAVAILGIAAVGVDKLGDSLAGINPDIDALSKRLVDLKGKGATAAQQLGEFGSNLDTFAADAGRSAVWFAPVVGGFESLHDTVSRLNSDGVLEGFATGFADMVTGVTGGLYTMDQGKQRLADFDATLSQLVASGNGAQAAALFNDLGKQSGLAGQDIGKLRDLLPGYSSAVEAAGGASAVAAGGIDQAKTKVDGFNKSLSDFSGRTDALTAMQNLKTAYNDAERAIDAANGKLQINAGMSDRQRDAVIRAREAFSTYIGAVKTAADGAFALTGRTTESTRAVIEQLPKLGELAGKNAEAKEQVLLLAKAYGISRDDAIKAMSSAEGLKKVLAELKSKEIRIGLVLDTAAAEKEFGSFLARYSNKSLAIALATKVKAAGGIQTAGGVDLMARGGIHAKAGAVALMAAGGMRTPPPNIANQATYVGGSNTVYAEAGKEAYVPYDPQYRDRAVQVLGTVAQDFGLSLGPGGVGSTSNYSTSSVANTSTTSAPSLTNYSRVSAPQQARSGSYSGSGGGAGGAASDSAPGSGTTVNKAVNFYGTTVREDVEADVLFRKASMYLDSRG